MWLLADIEVAKIIFLSALVLTSGWLLLRTYQQRRMTMHAETAPHDVDGKIVVLRRLMLEADQKIARLEALNERATRLTTGELSSGLPLLPITHQAGAEVPRRIGAKGGLRVDSGSGLRVDAPVERAGSPAARRQEEIYALADAGLTSAAIAGHIGSPVGEIELVLGLRLTRG